jgi:hypothetical protein
MASTTSPNDLVEVIHMESAVFSVAVIADVHVEFTDVPRCGRFSTGIERLPETPSTMHVGSFADGYEQIPQH